LVEPKELSIEQYSSENISAEIIPSPESSPKVDSPQIVEQKADSEPQGELDQSPRKEAPIEVEVEVAREDDDEDLFEDFEDPDPTLPEKPEGGSQKSSGSQEDSIEHPLGSEEDLFGDFEDFSQSSTPKKKPRRDSVKKQPSPKPPAPGPSEKSKIRPNQISSQVNGLLESIFTDFYISDNNGSACETQKPENATKWASIFDTASPNRYTQNPADSDSEEEMDIGKKILNLKIPRKQRRPRFCGQFSAGI
jgi:hypothetical protein